MVPSPGSFLSHLSKIYLRSQKKCRYIITYHTMECIRIKNRGRNVFRKECIISSFKKDGSSISYVSQFEISEISHVVILLSCV